MNTRGLMELIVLNIGYDMGILSPEIFTILVLMALITTFMTSPLLNLIDYFNTKFYKIKLKTIIKPINNNTKNILIAFGPASAGASLLRLLYSLYNFKNRKVNLIALHLTPHTEILSISALNYEERSFTDISLLADELKIDFTPIYKATDDVSKEIIKTAKEVNCDLLLMGAAQSIFSTNILGGKVKEILEFSNCNVGIFMNKNIQKIKNVLIISNFEKCNSIIQLFDKLLNYTPKLSLLNIENTAEDNAKRLEQFLKIPYYSDIRIINNNLLDKEFLKDFDLVILEFNYCEKNFTQKNLLIEEGPSLLILKLININTCNNPNA
jgi:nucleotide-binding universal stress UspA family protein